MRNNIRKSVPHSDLQQLFNQYESQAQFSKRLRPETIRGYKAVFNLFLKVMPEIDTPELLSPETLNQFFKRIQNRKRIVGRDTLKTGVKDSTIKTQWSKLNVFFNWLYIKNHIDKNPLEDIRPPKVSYDDFRSLEDADIHKIYSAIMFHSSDSFIQRRDTLMVSILLFCGVRKGEFISLRVTDIDMEKREITIRGETSKSRKTRVLPIHPTLLPHIKDYFKERSIRNLKTEFLIASSRDDRGLSRQGLKHWVKSLNKKSGVKFHLHMFRHTFAVNLDRNNVSGFKIQKLLGHASILMTQKYVRSIKTESLGEDVAKISY